MPFSAFTLTFTFFCVLSPFFSPILAENSVQLTEDYHLKWVIDKDNDKATFEITVNTTGFIGFGLSWQGKMLDADIVTAGVDDEGKGYIHDRHGTGEIFPPEDEHSDYTLEDSYEEDGMTYVKFSRILNTCDKQDISITADTTKVIWSFGETDTISYHGTTNRGVYAVSLIDGIPPEPDLEPYTVWKMRSNKTMPPVDTTYWCSYHPEPTLVEKHHVIGYDIYLDNGNPDAILHTHHLDIYKCEVPVGMEDVFREASEGEGFICDSNENLDLRQYCETFAYSWAIGGLVTMLPDNIGIPIGHNDKLYYNMFETHYDNPDELEKTFEVGMDVYYTKELRTNDAGWIVFGHDTTYSLILPPNSNNLLVAGHCNIECTKDIPDEGLNIFRILLHSHISGRKMKIRHFRGNEELPWLINDEHYDFNYQQNKPLNPYVVIQKEDTFTLECTYNSIWKNNSSTIGGLSTKDEMCDGFALYYPLYEPLNACRSHLPSDSLADYFGIQFQEGEHRYSDPIITHPEDFKDQLLSAFITNYNWTEEAREKYQDFILKTEHESFCKPPKEEKLKRITYPKLDKEYIERDICIAEDKGNANAIFNTFIITLFMILFGKIVI